MTIFGTYIDNIRQCLYRITLFINICVLTPMWTIGLCISLYLSLLSIAIDYDPSYILLTILLLFTFYILFDSDGRTGRRRYSRYSARNWSCFQRVASYFPITLHKTMDISTIDDKQRQQPKKAYLFLYQPHGVIGMGANTAINTNGCNFDEQFPNIGIHYGVTLDVPFYVPFLRDFMIALGFIHAQKGTLEHILRDRRESIVLVPGGAMEALYTQQNTFRCLMKTAPIRLAISTNASIVPCIGFGENNAFSIYTASSDSILFRIQKFICQQFSFSTPILLSPFPRRSPINVVIGAPLDFTASLMMNDTNSRDTAITESMILKCQTQYMSAVEKLYEEHKDRYGHSDIPLEWIPK